jgi:hypothetical protein
MSRTTTMITGIAIALVVALLLGPWAQRSLQIHACLDGGARWDYEKNQREGARHQNGTPRSMLLSRGIRVAVNKRNREGVLG